MSDAALIRTVQDSGPDRLFRFTLYLAIAWTSVIALAAVTTTLATFRTGEGHARIEAQAAIQKDLVYRRWAAGHGGVYVPVTAETPPNPDLAHIPERDITTPSGRQLTLVNPAYMTRQVHELGQRDYGMRGHITSLNPLRAANAPDAWERMALAAIQQGDREVTSISGDPPEMRHMIALRTEESCLKCHRHQGYRVGDIRGGLSVAVPMARFREAAIHEVWLDNLIFLMLWLAGLGVIGFGYRSLSRSIRSSQAAQRRYQDLVETSHDLIWQLDRDGLIVYLNPAWEQALGRPVAELLGRPFAMIKDPGDLECGQAAFLRMMAEGGVLENQESVFLHRDGHQVHLIIKAKAIIGSDGKATGCRGTAFDNTARRRIEEQLRQSEKMMAIGQLAGGIAHDFNNQLAGILGYAELLVKRSSDPAVQLYAGRIVTAARRSADLTGKMLAFARKGSSISVAVDLHGCIHETTAMLARSVDRSIIIREELSAPSAQVRGDPTLIQSALLNLAVNARDAMPDGGTLIFATRLRTLTEGEIAGLPAGEWIELLVRDTGCGMDERVRAHLFEPFFTTKGPGKGTGMGLAAVQGTVLSHGGAIHVDSQPGQGTTFRILLPQLRCEAAAPESAAIALPDLPRLRILVADDEAVVNDMLAELLRGEGHDVVAVRNGGQALAAFRNAESAFDVVILDLMMPEMDGRRCFQELRALQPGVRVLLASGFSADGTVQQLLDNGAAGFIQKPFRRDQLRLALAEALASGRGG